MRGTREARETSSGSKRRTDAAAYSYEKGRRMGKYFGREPRYSSAEIERQAQDAIDARVGLGRPPADDWAPLEARLSEMDQMMAAPPPVPALPELQPMQIREVRLPTVGAASPTSPAGSRSSRRVAAAAPAAD